MVLEQHDNDGTLWEGQAASMPGEATSTSHGLVMDEPEIELGVVKARATHRFAYKNAGNRLLTIMGVNASCSCIVSRPDQEKLHPGESGFVTLEIDLSRKTPGPHRFLVDVEYECEGRHVAKASMLASYQPDLRLVPDKMQVAVTEGGRGSAGF